jgi:hypothetical protein
VPVEDFLESVIEASLGDGEGQAPYQTTAEWEAALDEFADSPAFAKATNRFVDDSCEGIY